MNERIRELAEQADEYADAKLDMLGEYHPDWHDVRDEKFVELIVEECAGVILEWKSEPFPYDPEFGAKLIKEHFGV